MSKLRDNRWISRGLIALAIVGVGVLLATGWAPGPARRRLDELAAELAGDRAEAARAVLAGLDDPQQGPPAASS